MSTPHAHLVAIALAAAAATLPIAAVQRPSLPEWMAPRPLLAVSGLLRPSADVDVQMVSLREMHQRLNSVGVAGVTPELIGAGRRVLSDGVDLMRELRLGLASTVSEAGEVRRSIVTQAESDRIMQYLALMQLLVLLKADLDAAGQAMPPSANKVPAPVPPSAGSRGGIRSYTHDDERRVWRPFPVSQATTVGAWAASVAT